jgi:hypothetical protein
LKPATPIVHGYFTKLSLLEVGEKLLFGHARQLGEHACAAISIVLLVEHLRFWQFEFDLVEHSRILEEPLRFLANSRRCYTVTGIYEQNSYGSSAREVFVLFNNVSILDVLPDQLRQIKQKVQEFKADYLLNASEDDLVASLVDEFTLDVPVLDEEGAHVDHHEQQIDVSRDPMRMIFDRSQPFYIPGTRITIIVPFSGDGNIFGLQPQSGTFSVGRSRAEVKKGEIHFTFSGPSLDGNAVRREFDNELGLIRQNLGNLKAAIDRHSAELPTKVRQEIQQRKTKLLADAKMVAAIGFPIKKREGIPTTYALPVQKRRPRIERPASSSATFQPEPTLAMAEYDEILAIVRNMVKVMEQSPKAFEKMGEEDLRTHFLVQLNGQYEGRATGETFNYLGKTDILIREEGKNVFIAECKFWGGEKQFLETIDQLLSYLSWRDTKTAVLIFNRNQNFTEVLRKLEESTPKHPNFKRLIAKLDESSFRYVFHQPEDKNREVVLTVLVFNVPRPEAKT